LRTNAEGNGSSSPDIKSAFGVNVQTLELVRDDKDLQIDKTLRELEKRVFYVERGEPYELKITPDDHWFSVDKNIASKRIDHTIFGTATDWYVEV